MLFDEACAFPASMDVSLFMSSGVKGGPSFSEPCPVMDISGRLNRTLEHAKTQMDILL